MLVRTRRQSQIVRAGLGLLVGASGVSAQEGNRQQPTGRQPTPLAISISGGISKGAYQAGVIYGTLHSLRWLAALDSSPDANDFRAHTRRESHRVSLHATTGASAGTINALLAAIEYCKAEGSGAPSASLLWKAWGPVGIDELLPGADQKARARSKEGKLSSLLDRTVIQQGPMKVVREALAAPKYTPGCSVPVGITLTKVGNSERSLTEDFRFVAARHALLFSVSTADSLTPQLVFKWYSPESADESRRMGILVDVPYDCANVLSTDEVLNAVLASAAFPGAFSPVRVRTETRSEKTISERRMATPSDCGRRNFQSSLFADGGVFDNNPLDLLGGILEDRLVVPVRRVTELRDSVWRMEATFTQDSSRLANRSDTLQRKVAEQASILVQRQEQKSQNSAAIKALEDSISDVDLALTAACTTRADEDLCAEFTARNDSVGQSRERLDAARRDTADRLGVQPDTVKAELEVEQASERRESLRKRVASLKDKNESIESELESAKATLFSLQGAEASTADSLGRLTDETNSLRQRLQAEKDAVSDRERLQDALITIFVDAAEKEIDSPLTASPGRPGSVNSIIESALTLLQSALPAARSYELQIAERNRSRWFRNSLRATERSLPLAGASFSGFGAFLGESLRKYDYAVGVRAGVEQVVSVLACAPDPTSPSPTKPSAVCRSRLSAAILGALQDSFPTDEITAVVGALAERETLNHQRETHDQGQTTFAVKLASEVTRSPTARHCDYRFFLGEHLCQPVFAAAIRNRDSLAAAGKRSSCGAAKDRESADACGDRFLYELVQDPGKTLYSTLDRIATQLRMVEASDHKLTGTNGRNRALAVLTEYVLHSQSPEYLKYRSLHLSACAAELYCSFLKIVDGRLLTGYRGVPFEFGKEVIRFDTPVIGVRLLLEAGLQAVTSTQHDARSAVVFTSLKREQRTGSLVLSSWDFGYQVGSQFRTSCVGMAATVGATVFARTLRFELRGPIASARCSAGQIDRGLNAGRTQLLVGIERLGPAIHALWELSH